MMVNILIDSGLIHSFIDQLLVKQLKLIAEITPLSVTVTDGNTTIIDTACKALWYLIQGHQFSTDLRLYPLGGFDIILGVDWLR